MTSTPVAKIPKAKPKKTLKRVMLAALEEPSLLTIDKSADELIESTLINYLKEFSNRGDISRRIMLGLNSITRSVESSSEHLEAVLINANVRPPRLVIHLQQLCIHKRVPVAAIRGMDKIARALQGTVKALKMNITAVGILGGCSAEVVCEILGALPLTKVKPAKAAEHSRRSSPTRPPSPPRPKVDVRKLFIEMKSADAPKIDAASGVGGGDPTASGLAADPFGQGLVYLSANATPFVDYTSFIGSHRPLEEKVPKPFDQQAPSTSGYKPPVMKIR